MTYGEDGDLRSHAKSFIEQVQHDAQRYTIDLDTPPEDCWTPIRSHLQDGEYWMAGRYFSMALRDLNMAEVKTARKRFLDDAPGCSEWLTRQIELDERDEFAVGAEIQQSIVEAGIDTSQRGRHSNTNIKTWAMAYLAEVNDCIRKHRD